MGHDNEDSLCDLFKALETTSKLKGKLKTLAQQILTHFLKPLSKIHDLIPQYQDNEQEHVLSMKMKPGMKKLSKPSQQGAVYEKLLGVLLFFKTNLFGVLYKNTGTEHGLDPMGFIGMKHY